MEAKEVRRYKKEFPYSYALGAFAVLELVAARPEQVLTVILHSSYKDQQGILDVCREKGIPVQEDDKAFRRLSQKENCYAIGVFLKHEAPLDMKAPHIVLVNPGDMGNLGTIIRTIAGFGICDLAVITPGADVYHPKTVRASMGAVFRVRVSQYKTFDEYRKAYPDHQCFPFMLDGEEILRVDIPTEERRFSLIFGNEASGLDRGFRDVGRSVRIPQSPLVDSLNLANAVGIGAFVFASAAGMVGEK